MSTQEWEQLIDKIRWQDKRINVEGELIKINEYTYKDKKGFTFDLKQNNGSIITINGHKMINDFIMRLKIGDTLKVMYRGINPKTNKQDFKLFVKRFGDGTERTL